MKVVNIFFVRRNTTEYPYLVTKAVSADGTRVEQVQWRVPVHRDGIHVGFKYVADGAKPSADSVKVLKLVDTLNNEIFYAAIPDTADESAWANAVNSCCDEPVNMPAVTLPEIFVEEEACADADGNYNYFTFTQALGASQVYVGSATKNGALQPALSDAGYTSLANLVTAANTAWTGFELGVTNPAGTKVLAKSASAVSGSVSVEVRNYYESAADASLASGAHFTLDAVVNGVALPKLTGVADGALATIAALANANPHWARFGKYSVVSNKIRLVAFNNVDSAALTLTEVAP
jgi:hypothetical protein